MKICRFCWEICTHDEEWCDGLDVEKHEKCYEFFVNPKDMINHLVNQKSKSALKLLELVEERIQQLQIKRKRAWYPSKKRKAHTRQMMYLKRLLYNSQNTKEDKGILK